MTHSLPPLNALRAFEVAARQLSFKKAARELHVTPAAISHQIKALEEYLGVQLFQRLNRALQLTEVGQACLPKLQEGFNCLKEAVEQVSAQTEVTHLTVSVAPSFAAKWLLPRLYRFATAHPDIDMRVSASMALVDRANSNNREQWDFRKRGVDVAIRFGRGKYQGFRVDKLFSVAIVPLCSPRLLEGEHPLLKPDDLRYHVLLHDDTLYLDERRPDWNMWLKYAGVKGIDSSRGQHFSHAVLALEAAVEGQGVVLSLRTLAAADLTAGRLVVPFELSIPLSFGYYIVCPETVADRPDIVAFRNWLLEEARLDQ
jgi:LysR family glycine cleavage system transcriptional activator